MLSAFIEGIKLIFTSNERLKFDMLEKSCRNCSVSYKNERSCTTNMKTETTNRNNC